MAAIDKDGLGLTVMVLHDDQTTMERLRHEVDFVVAGGVITFELPSYIKGPFTAEVTYAADQSTMASNYLQLEAKEKPRPAWLQLQPNNESWRNKKRGRKSGR